MGVCLLFLCFLLGSSFALINKHKDDRYQHPKLPTPQRIQIGNLHPDLWHPTLFPDQGVFVVTPQETASDFWMFDAQNILRKQLKKEKIEGVAKNVILFVGDGMSMPTITAGRIHMGGERAHLAFDEFPYTGLSKTYCVDRQVADSACTSTAYLTGVKANFHTIGVTASVKLDDCESQNNTGYHTQSIATWSQTAKKRTGFVTTTRVTHASPAGIYAHIANRNWESDTDIVESGKDPKVCPDIAYQLINSKAGKNLNVIIGGGRGTMLPSGSADEEQEEGWRSDGRNLIEQWKKEKHGMNSEYVWNREQLRSLNGSLDYLLGLFDSSHLAYNLDRNKELEPSLEEMVSEAIRTLRRGPNGYFLFVEGGRIDTAHHDGQARKSLDELKEFNKAVQKAVDMTSEEDTLIVVTADHAHSMAFSGYPVRGHDVLGLSGLKDTENYDYFTLGYANGPGYRKANPDGTRKDCSKENYEDADFKYPGMYPLDAEAHGGEDVPIYARGPWAHLFTGVLEENAIPHIMAFASCVGDGLTACELGDRFPGKINH